MSYSVLLINVDLLMEVYKLLIDSETVCEMV